MRLFIAIELSQSMRDEIVGIQDVLRKADVRGNYTRQENLHITLAFIGEYDDIDRVLEVIEASDRMPFQIELEGFGAFGDLWWVGLAHSEPLLAYVRQLRHRLADAGIPFDRKRFSPHITILRRAVCERDVPDIAVKRMSMTVERAVLMRSDRGKNGMIYTRLQ